MWQEVYYEHYAENMTGEYWKEEKKLPYMVLEHDITRREEFKACLIEQGFRCCDWNDIYPGILVNVKFRRFAMIHRPCNFSHLDNKEYSINEFTEMILGEL